MTHVNQSPRSGIPVANGTGPATQESPASASPMGILPASSLCVPPPLLPYPAHCAVGRFVSRHKRFSVALRLRGEETWVHSNNSGSMLGLKRPGMPVMVSPASNPQRKLAWTQEAVWMEWGHPLPHFLEPCATEPAAYDCIPSGFWVGVNTSMPNRLLAAAFAAGRLPFAAGYTHLQREAQRGDSRLDACLTAPTLTPLWVECKNVTMVEDDVACFPDAATERGQKHLRALMDIVGHGERAAMFYLIQRADGHCFGPADVIDPTYAELFWLAQEAGVEIYPFRASITAAGIDLGELLPIARRP